MGAGKGSEDLELHCCAIETVETAVARRDGDCLPLGGRPNVGGAAGALEGGAKLGGGEGAMVQRAPRRSRWGREATADCN